MTNPNSLNDSSNIDPEILAQEAGRLAADALLSAEDAAEREDILVELQEELAEAGVVVVDVKAQDEGVAPARTGVVTGRTREAVIADRSAPLKVRKRRAADALRRTKG